MAVVAYQKAKGLDPDGIVGRLTWAALDKTPSVTPVTPTPTNTRDRLISALLDNAAMLIGTDYSKEQRDRIFPGGSFDCSSFIYSAYAAAGFPLLTAKLAELRASTTEVSAEGFDLIYPASRALIGKALPSPKGLLSSYGAAQGDIVFFGLDASTTRANKITHVAMIDRGALKLIQTANNREKCCRVPLTKYDGYVCAIIRLRSDAQPPKLAEIAKGDQRAYMVRMLQIALNLRHGERLTCDGDFGSKTAAAVAEINAELGISGSTVTAKTWAALEFPNDVQQ
jgi:peptidoglycan hydrolase-like protein with peptidoglycan-binding domain